MAKAIIFDMTQTMQQFDFSRMQKEFHKIIKAIPLAKKIPIKQFMKAYFKNYDLYQTGKITSDKEFCTRIFLEFGIRLTKKCRDFFVQEHLKRRKKFIGLALQLKETLSALKRAGFKLGLLSNGVKNWVGFDWRFLGFNPKKFFEMQVYSQETGKTKPNPAMYELILKKMRLKPSETVFVGDNYKHDVLGPKKAGMKTIWLNKLGKKKKADFAIRKLTELPKLKNALLQI